MNENELRAELLDVLSARVKEVYGDASAPSGTNSDMVVGGISDWALSLLKKYAVGKVLEHKQDIIDATVKAMNSVLAVDIPGIGEEVEKQVDEMIVKATVTMLGLFFQTIEELNK